MDSRICRTIVVCLCEYVEKLLLWTALPGRPLSMSASHLISSFLFYFLLLFPPFRSRPLPPCFPVVSPVFSSFFSILFFPTSLLLSPFTSFCVSRYVPLCLLVFSSFSRFLLFLFWPFLFLFVSSLLFFLFPFFFSCIPKPRHPWRHWRWCNARLPATRRGVHQVAEAEESRFDDSAVSTDWLPRARGTAESECAGERCELDCSGLRGGQGREGPKGLGEEKAKVGIRVARDSCMILENRKVWKVLNTTVLGTRVNVWESRIHRLQVYASQPVSGCAQPLPRRVCA